MSRTFRHSTALAAMIAVAAPQLGAAQARIPQGEIEAHRAAMEAEQPSRAAKLARELAGGLTVAGLTCSDPSAAQPCPPGTPLVTPEGIAVVLGEDDSILLAPRAAQRGADAAVAVEAAPEAEAAPAADAAPEAEAAPEAAPEAAAPEAAPEPAPQAAAPEAVPEPAPQAAAPEAAPEAAPAEAAATPDAEELARRLAGQGDAPAAAPADAAPQAGDAGTSDHAAAPAKTSAEATPTAAGQAASATAEAPAAPDSTAPATAAGETAAPAALDAEELARRLAGEGGNADTDTPPEARAEQPDEAAQRAAEAEAPVAAALDVADDAAAPADAGEAITVTEGGARSSAEDFSTSVAEATRTTQAATGSGSNRDRDLARALLAGLAGYAVGQAVGDHGQVALNSGDRVVITRQDGSQQVLKDDGALLFQPGARVQTQNFDDGSSRIIVTREDGSRVVTIRDANLRVLRRTLIHPDGSEVKLIDDTTPVQPVRVSDLPPPARPLPPPALNDEAALRAALEAAANQSRRFTLGQIRDIAGVRALVAPVNIDAITFDTGSAAIRPDQARQLAALGKVIADYVRANPGEMFLVEGYTDTVGADAMNLALSDRRAESLALALTEYFGVPPENLVVQGYGERFLKIPREGDVRENRRVAVRRITDLLARN